MYEPYDQAISKIQNYIIKHFPEMSIPYPSYIFENRSYGRWAADEIIERIIIEDAKFCPYISNKEPISVLDIIDDFMYDIDRCGYEVGAKGNSQLQEIMEVAHDTAKCIRRLFV